MFQAFVERTEAQLVGSDSLRIRGVVDEAYTATVKTMFECLQHMAKMNEDGAGVAGEDKDQLNYHVVLIGGLPFFLSYLSKSQPFCSLYLGDREHAPLPDNTSEPKDASAATLCQPSQEHLRRKSQSLRQVCPSSALGEAYRAWLGCKYNLVNGD
jgi:Exocyst complex component Sec3